MFGASGKAFCVGGRNIVCWCFLLRCVPQECANQHDPAQTRITAELVFIYIVFQGFGSFIYLYSDDDEDGNGGYVDDDDRDSDGDGAPWR